MKHNVIKFFQNLPVEKHEQFNEAFKLYRDSPNKNVIVERTLNAGGYSERALENLLYDLQKMHDISDVEKVSVQVPVLSLQNEDDAEKWDLLDEDIVQLFKSLLGMSFHDACSWGVARQEQFNDVDVLLELANETGITEVSECLGNVWAYLTITIPNQVINDITVNDADTIKGTTENRPDNSDPGILGGTDFVDAARMAVDALKTPETVGVDFGVLKEENADLVFENENLTSENEDLQDEKTELLEENESLKEKIQTLKLSPKIDNQSIRVEFPFLNNADCPDEFKILIADKITAWNRYLELQADIAKAELGENTLDAAQLALIAKEAVQCFDENQKIYDELNAYQATGKVLGVHPIFRRLQLTREVEVMTPDELHNFKGSSAKYFSDNRKQLAKAVKGKNEERILEINTRVADREVKLALVNKTLGISPK